MSSWRHSSEWYIENSYSFIFEKVILKIFGNSFPIVFLHPFFIFSFFPSQQSNYSPFPPFGPTLAIFIWVFSPSGSFTTIVCPWSSPAAQVSLLFCYPFLQTHHFFGCIWSIGILFCFKFVLWCFPCLVLIWTWISTSTFHLEL